MITVKQKADCCGCYACATVCPENCISMVKDDDGFWYPSVDLSICINCGVCEKACPVLTPSPNNKTSKILSYAAYTKDEQIRMESSSGGLFTEIAKYVILQGGVVFGAAFDEEHDVVHTYTESLEGLEAFRGSKYVQSKIGDTYSVARAFLKQGRIVLFTGTPCQIEGLLTFLGREYDNLITQDIICHGVPSPMVWRKYIEYREQTSASATQRTFFRHKKYGWKTYSVRFIFTNRTEYVGSLNEDPYMRGFLADLCLRPSCYACHFKNKYRKSDFTLADFWGIQNVCPEMDDDKGTSLIFVNSDRGAQIFDAVRERIVTKEVDADIAIGFNSSMIKSVDEPRKRKNFLNDIKTQDFVVVVQKYCRGSFLRKVYRKLRRILWKIIKH